VSRRFPTRRQILPLALLVAATGCTLPPPPPPAPAGADRPNVVLIYADDLGYGDVGSYGATRVATPNIDRLAREGLRFTHAHSPAATCTPSRYAMLTGEYAWRRRGTGVLPGDAAAIIEPGRTTLATILRDAGYATGVVGKWHLGLGPEGGPDWNGEIRPGPLEIGFDYAFLMPATGDRVPTVYVEDHRVVGLDPADPIRVSFQAPLGGEPTGKENPQLLRMHPSHGHDQTIVNGVSRIGYMSGGRAARWVDEQMADVFAGKAVAFLEEHRREPFFLYFATHDIHVPRLPHPRFVGRSGMGPRGDAILELDWQVGEVLAALDRLGLAENTLVLFTSDNGPVVDDGYRDQAVELLGDHRPAGPLRGGKYSAFEGGTRVPFIVRWPRRVAPGTSGALLSQVDFPATFAALTGVPLAPGDAPDSEDVLPALLGDSPRGRSQLVEQGGPISIIRGDWKLIEPRNGARVNAQTNTETGNNPQPQLYNLAEDPGERVNRAAERPELVAELTALLERIRAGEGGGR
jgi:arylsulfatase A-like enzyme